MLPEIHTERLLLRMATASDIGAVSAYYRTHRRYLATHQPDRPESFYEKDHWAETVAEWLTLFREDRSLMLWLFPKNDPTQVVGSVHFSQFVRGGFQSCVLGYGLAEDSQGLGYMAEALGSAIDYVFKTLNMHRIGANYKVSNVRSARVLEKLGFEQEGLAREYLYVNGQWADHVLTSLRNPEWQSL